MVSLLSSFFSSYYHGICSYGTSSFVFTEPLLIFLVHGTLFCLFLFLIRGISLFWFTQPVVSVFSYSNQSFNQSSFKFFVLLISFPCHWEPDTQSYPESDLVVPSRFFNHSSFKLLVLPLGAWRTKSVGDRSVDRVSGSLTHKVSRDGSRIGRP